MKSLRTPVLLMAALVWMAGSVPAQVAAPSLLPDEVLPANPAALQWDDASRAVIGYGRGEVEPQGESYDTEGGRAGLLAMWSWGAFAAEGENSRSTSGDSDVTTHGLRGALSVKLTKWLSLGVLGQQTGFDQEDPAGLRLEFDSSILAFGAGLKLADFLYLGYAQGRDDVDGKISASLPTPTSIEFSDQRGARAYGGGIRTGKTFRFHAEYYVIEFDPIEVPTNIFAPEGAELDEHKDSTGALEVGWRNFVLGGRWTDSDQKSDDRQKRIAEYALAWVRKSGIGLAYRYRTERTEDDGTGDLYEKRTGHAASLVYLF